MNVITLTGDVDYDMTAKLQQQLLEFEGQSNETLVLYINSSGGDVRQSLAMYDLIITSKCDILGVVVGNCYSAAYTILQACSKRYATPNSEFMAHKGMCEVGGTHTSEFISAVKSELKGQRISDDIMFNRTTNKKALKRLYEKGAYFPASKALELGVIDAVIKNRFSLKG